MTAYRTPNRRTFCLAAAATLGSLRGHAFAQSQLHPDIANIDHDRILAAAALALNASVAPITSFPAPKSAADLHDFYFASGDGAEAFTAHRDAVYSLGRSVAALTAAGTITNDPRYAAKAAEHLRSWFIAPATRMKATLQGAGHFESILETVPLAEVAHSLGFLAVTDALTSDELATIRKWFADYETWLKESRTGGLARDQKNHHGSSWLFQCAAYADANVSGLTSDDANLNELRHRFHTATLRAQINATGNFPHEVSSPTPYRDSLFNLDLLCLACDLLTTRFDNPWEYELQDGPGMRSAIAYHFPFILNRAAWPYPADLTHFKELPARRISLLLAGRAYRRPDYVDLWKSLSPLPDTASPELLRSFPISQPLLWFTHAKPRRS